MNIVELTTLQSKVIQLRAEGKYKDTIENCYNLLEAGIQLKDYKSALVAYLNLAASYYCIGDIEEAFKCISLYEDICDNHGDEIDKLNLYNVMFILYEYTKAYDKAINTLERSIHLSINLKKYNIASNGYSNYSHVCMINGDYTKALEMATLGLEMAELHIPDNPILKIRVKLNIALAYIGLKDFGSSKALIDKMINDTVLDSFIREKSQCYHLLGKWYSEQMLNREAFEAFTMAKVLVETYNDVYLLKTIQEDRCKLCELMNEIDLGYKVQKEYISLLKEISARELSLAALKVEIKHSISTLEKKANTDPLTGIYNRNFIENTANNWLIEAYKENESIVCLVFDIDNFKSINDEYGHLFGDEVIKLVSATSANMVRENDLIGRYGGDEFVIILKGASLDDGVKKAEQILETVRNLNISKNNKSISITLSIGVTNNLDCSALHFNELFNAADIRLYNAKRSGRNCVCAIS